MALKLFGKEIHLKGVVTSTIRGLIKSVPGGNVITEIIGNIGHKDDKNPKPHNWWSITLQMLSIGAIIYAFATKIITIDQLLGYLGFDNSTPPTP